VGDKLDVVLAERAFFLMRNKGRLRLVWTGVGLPHDACYDGRYVWIPVKRGPPPPSLFVLDPQTGKKWEVTARDGLPEIAAKDLPEKYTEQYLMAAPLSPGKVCLAGTFGRSWIGIATFDPAKGASVKIFHEAREVADDKDQEQGNRTTAAFNPVWMQTLTSKPDASGRVSQRVLIGRDSKHWRVGSRSLLVDPDNLSVELAPIDVRDFTGSRAYGNAIYGSGSTGHGNALIRMTFPGTVERVWDKMPANGRVRLVGDRVNVIDYNSNKDFYTTAHPQWWTGSLARKELHMARDMPPQVDDVYESAHYGLLFAGRPVASPKFIHYQVVFNNVP
jgi:hypothetical protein